MGFHTHLTNADPRDPRQRTLEETGRLHLAKVVVESGWALQRAAERFNCSPATAKQWADRHRTRGRGGMKDFPSRLRTDPHGGGLRMIGSAAGKRSKTCTEVNRRPGCAYRLVV